MCCSWPQLDEILSQMSCCSHDTVDIFLPDIALETLTSIRDLVTTGGSAPVGYDTVDDLKNLLGWNVERNELEALNTTIEENDEEDEFQNYAENVVFNDVEMERNPVIQVVEKTCCAKNCSNSCHSAVKSWPLVNVTEFKEMFKAEKTIQIKQKLMNHLITQERVGQPVASFIVKRQQFCEEYFANMIGFSEHIVKTVLRDFHTGIRLYRHGNSGCMKQESPATIGAICWLKSFGEAYGQFSPDENVLSYWLNKQSLFKMYSDEASGPLVSQSQFYTIFKTKFGHQRLDHTLPWLRISKYSTHSVCSICVALNNNQKQCKTENEVKQATALKNNHRINFGLARRKVEEIKQSSISFPADNLFIQIDGMDNSKSYLPHYLEHSKDQAQKGRLPSKISGCTIYNGWYEKKRKVLFYINHDIFENGSNMVVTIVYLLLQEFIKDHQKLPRKLHLNLDNCWKENKNRFLFSFLASLLQLNVFEEISCDYLMVGHTGNEVDQLFSILCKQFKTDITTLEILKERILSAPIIPKPICRSLDFIYDWKQFIEDKLTQPPLKYQSKYNSFLLTLEICDDKRCVMLRGKKLPQDTELVPRSGIRIIKDDLEFPPVGPAGFRVENIKFDEIMRGLQIFMSKLDFQERMKITASWDRLRDSLESLPRRSNNFLKMKLEDLIKQIPEVLHVPDYLMEQEDTGTELTGDKYPENIDDGDLDAEICVGMDICVYTEERRGRPWVGRIVQLLENKRFLIHWFTRKTIRSKVFSALFKADGNRNISEQENGTVMFWQMTENRTKNSFSLSNFWLETLQRQYEALDGE